MNRWTDGEPARSSVAIYLLVAIDTSDGDNFGEEGEVIELLSRSPVSLGEIRIYSISRSGKDRPKEHVFMLRFKTT